MLVEPFECFIAEVPRGLARPKVIQGPFIVFSESIADAKGLAALRVPNDLHHAGNYLVFVRKFVNEA